MFDILTFINLSVDGSIKCSSHKVWPAAAQSTHNTTQAICTYQVSLLKQRVFKASISAILNTSIMPNVGQVIWFSMVWIKVRGRASKIHHFLCLALYYQIPQILTYHRHNRCEHTKSTSFSPALSSLMSLV